ncbi:MAG: large subunit ribosomal protein L9 [Limisphaerales bacterium]|jgi:large subunit ribosomal protein L9
MEVILKQDKANLGKAFDLVKVKAGYGRNYLIPKGIALLANASNKKRLAEMILQQEGRQAKLMAELQKVADKFKGAVIKVGAKVGKEDKIFGSITTIQLADAIKKQLSVDVDRKLITLPEDVKTTGNYTAKVGLHKEQMIEVAFEVVGE